MKSRKRHYWKNRFKQLEEIQYRQGEEYYKVLKEQFRMATNSIQLDIEKWYRRLAENNDISYMSARKFLSERQLEEFEWDINQYIEYGERNALNHRWMKELENASARHHISYLEAMKLQIQQEAEKLYSQMDGSMTAYLQKTYSENYCHTAYEISRGTGIGYHFHAPDNRQIEKMLQKPWAADGDNYSSRIWKNKDKLLNVLNKELTQNIIRGDSLEDISRRISQQMDVNMRRSRALIQTESAAVSARAQRECFQELEVEEFEVVETLDGHTCSICSAMDGKHFPMSQFEVGITAPPFHTNCRGCTCPWFDDEFAYGDRAARDNEGRSYYVPETMTYEEWERSFVKHEPQDMLSLTLME